MTMVLAMHHLVGSAEIGTMLGVGRQRVQQLISRDDFPRPAVKLAMGKIWKRADVEAWARDHGRAIGDETSLNDEEAHMPDTTPTVNTRVPDPMWDAYGRVCARLGTDRTADLLDHMREQIAAHGDEADLTDVLAAEKELLERRARKGGRPRSSG
jgi:predicted DNA-binding transcriptional regulator AlpA